MDYFVKETDNHGFTHSIDNLILEYTFKSTTYAIVRKFLEKVQQLSKTYDDINYYEKLDLNACRKYSFAKDFIHLDDGIVLFFGTQVEKMDTPLKSGDKYFILPLMKMEINPNKHSNKPIVKELLNLLKGYACDIRIIRYDYAIDIPLVPDDVQVFGTNKEKGLFKGTRYFGQRNKNGYTRIYDKAKEQNLESPLTRVETVISLTKTTKSISFEKVYYKSNLEKTTYDKLTKTDKALIELCEMLRTNGLDYEKGLSQLDARKKRFITEQLGKTCYQQLEFDKDLLDRLLNKCKLFFDVNQETEEMEVDCNDAVNAEGGYCKVSNDVELLFD